MYDRRLGAYFGAQFDEGADANEAWVAIIVYHDGVPLQLARFASEEDAEACAIMEWHEIRRRQREADDMDKSREKFVATAYGEWCRKPAACAGKGYCPLDPTCGD